MAAVNCVVRFILEGQSYSMNVTFIDHSGFFLETESAYFLFDYYQGEIPKLNMHKPLLVFVSHGHADHYNPAIFELVHQYPYVQFIIPKGTQIKKYVLIYKEKGIDLSAYLMLVKKNETYEAILKNGTCLRITTLKSTDLGVAYLLDYEGKTFYHAGDLNLWVWEEESSEYNKNMIRKYFTQLEKLKGKEIDIAFVPLDSRQGKNAFAGMESFLEYTNTKYIFPMHMWGAYDIIVEFLKKHPKYERSMMKIEYAGQEFLF